MTSQVPSEEAERAQLVADAMLTQNSLALEAQLEERPLAKKQEELQGMDISAEGTSGEGQHSLPSGTPQIPSTVAIPAQDNNQNSSKTDRVASKALLMNDDAELERIGEVRPLFHQNFTFSLTRSPLQLLEEVHKRFFSAYDNRLVEKPKRRPSINRLRDLPAVSHDVTVGLRCRQRNST